MNKTVTIEEKTIIHFKLDANYIGRGGEYPMYNGPYEVAPKFINQTLETQEKAMKKNVIVNEIPVQKAENLGGGYTVTIGG